MALEENKMYLDWHVETGAFSPEQCDSIISAGLSKPLEYAKIGGDVEGRVDFSFRRTKLRWLDISEIEQVYTRVFLTAKAVNRDSFSFDIGYGIKDIQFTEYHSDDMGFYNWHQDTFYRSPSLFDRKLSVVIQLSDPDSYEGGEFEFDRCEPLPQELFRPRGSMIIFPSFQYHKVTEVTRGIRHSLVMWVDGPKWR